MKPRRSRLPGRSSSALCASALFGLCLTAGFGPPLAAQEEEELEEVPMDVCLMCHGDDSSTFTIEFADGVEASSYVDEPSYVESPHGQMACVVCHAGLDPMEHMDEERGTFRDLRLAMNERCQACHEAGSSGGHPFEPSQRIEETLHSADADEAPLCTDCHGAHSVQPSDALRTSVSRACADCHEALYSDFASSAHGAGLVDAQNMDVPACTDCHPGHREEGKGAVARQVRMGRPCIGCHGDEQLMEPYGLSTAVVSTYLSDFHGVSVKFYDEEEAADLERDLLVCADCHGVHDVQRVAAEDPALMKASLVGVCQRCHEGASATFPGAWLSHYEPSLTSAPLVYLVKVAYWIFIPLVILGLSVQIFLHVVLFPLRKRRNRKSGRASKRVAPALEPVAPAPGQPRQYVRFGRRVRVEHLLVVVSFLLLLITGLPQKFHEAEWSARLVVLLGGVDLVRAIHRVTAIVFTGVAVSHLTHAVWGILRRGQPVSMAITRKDFRDTILNMKWYLGRSDRAPRFDRYDYKQKFEYWGMILGSAIMIASGFILFFPLFFGRFLPGQVIAAAKTAHSYEAMMALLTIISWHMYGVILNPETFPLDTSIFTGKISHERMLHEHPLELARLQQRDAEAAEPMEPGTPPGETPREPDVTGPVPPPREAWV